MIGTPCERFLAKATFRHRISWHLKYRNLTMIKNGKWLAQVLLW
jgi:hypothetical protein